MQKIYDKLSIYIRNDIRIKKYIRLENINIQSISKHVNIFHGKFMIILISWKKKIIHVQEKVMYIFQLTDSIFLSDWNKRVIWYPLIYEYTYHCNRIMQSQFVALLYMCYLWLQSMGWFMNVDYILGLRLY